MRVMDIPTIRTPMDIPTVHSVWDLVTQGKNDAVLSDELLYSPVRAIANEFLSIMAAIMKILITRKIFFLSLHWKAS